MHVFLHRILLVILLAIAAFSMGACRDSCPEGSEQINGQCRSIEGDDDDSTGDDDDSTGDDDDSTGDDDDDSTGDDDDSTGDDDDDTFVPNPAILRSEGGRFLDSVGAEIILRGVNVAGNSKVPPFVPFTDLSLMDSLPGLGVNVIRLLFTWEAFEGTRGVYDDAYLDAITAIADKAFSLGIYVIIDFHQDGFSRFHGGGCGDGFPQWAVHAGASLDTPDNSHSCANWATQISLDTDMHDSFSAFYADENGVRTSYLDLWSYLAGHFASRQGVIGFDLFNEPWGWEATELSPLYEDAALGIRTQAADKILFIEGHGSSNSGSPLTQTSLLEPTFDNYAYAPHFYETAVITTHLFPWPHLPTATNTGFSTMSSKADEWGVPLFVGEFGAFEDTLGVEEYMDLQYDRLDDHFASGTQWNWTPGWTTSDVDGWNGEDLSIIDDNGALRANFRIRAGPRRIAGNPLQFDDEDATISVRWEHDERLGATEIFLPADVLWGSSLPQINVLQGDINCSYLATERLLSCESETSGEVFIEISAG
jgi:endoglycosylceramidase